jgi:transcriptional regulator with XRE-family HTH domain
MDKPDFSNFLLTELRNRQWSQSELARRSKLSRAAISNYINRSVINPDKSALSALATAFGYPDEILYQAAGDLETPPSIRKISEQIAEYKLNELNDKQLDEVLQFIEFIQERDERFSNQNKHNREGSSPPEMVKSNS